MNKFKNIYTYIAFQLLTVVLILATLEGGVRLFMGKLENVSLSSTTILTAEGQEPFFEYHPFAGFKWIPHARFLKQSVNSDGFVSTREIPFEREDNELRIITLGGSSTVGNGNTDEQTYPRVLERLLQERYPDRRVNVINAAAGGYTTIESLGYLRSRLLYYKPDIIIVMHGWNDMYYFTKTDREISQWRKDFNIQAVWNRNIATRFEELLPWDVRYLSWSQLYLHLRKLLRSRMSDEDSSNVIEKRLDTLERDENGKLIIKQKPITEPALLTYTNNMKQFQNICTLHNIQCMAILQPTLLLDHPDPTSTKYQNSASTSLLYHGFGAKQHVVAFNQIYSIIESIFPVSNIIDARIMNGKEQLFFDRIHQNAAGTEQLAKLAFYKIISSKD